MQQCLAYSKYSVNINYLLPCLLLLYYLSQVLLLWKLGDLVFRYTGDYNQSLEGAKTLVEVGLYFRIII